MLFVMPSADFFADPGIYTFMGTCCLFEHIGLDYTLSAYTSEGGNFGLFTSHEMIKRLNYKIYAEAKRLGVKWILGGECGHMWRVIHQYMDTMNGPADFLEAPVSPITGTPLRQRRVDEDGAHLRVHRRPDARRQAEARQVAERPPPRHVPRLVQPGARDGPARGTARGHPRRRATTSSRCPRTRFASRRSAAQGARAWATTRTWRCACAAGCRVAARWRTFASARRQPVGVRLRDRSATLPPLVEYWAPGVEVTGVHELVGNALVMDGEKPRTSDLRGRPMLAGGRRPVHDAKKILPGLALFVADCRGPFWWNLASGAQPTVPTIEVPVGDGHCIDDAATCGATTCNCSELARRRRSARGDRVFVTADGRQFTQEPDAERACSVTATSRASATDATPTSTCHPYCWDCHVDHRREQ